MTMYLYVAGIGLPHELERRIERVVDNGVYLKQWLVKTGEVEQ